MYPLLIVRIFWFVWYGNGRGCHDGVKGYGASKPNQDVGPRVNLLSQLLSRNSVSKFAALSIQNFSLNAYVVVKEASE